eukprot:scaffold11375_cov123-Isochrysis_galbana.AAC.6
MANNNKKIFRRKRYSLAATWLGSSALLPSGHSLSPPPFFPHPVFLVQAAISGGWCLSCVHSWRPGARARTRLSRGRAIIPGMSSRRCCQRGLALRPCPRSDSPQLAPAEAGEAPS